MTLHFGTDGVRGRALEDLTTDLATALGRAIVRVLGGRAVLVARDTRESGPALEAALCRGVVAEGADALVVGVLPTPGLAWLSERDGLAAAMISASHNSYEDNGVKVFAAGGRKLTVEEESAIESAFQSLLAGAGASGAGGGETRSLEDPRPAYTGHLIDALDGRDLAGLRVVVDAAHGAAADLAGAVFATAGAEVLATLGDRPDGRNINAGVGSTAPERAAATTVDLGADLGFALDGDADRVIAVDGLGGLVDGDHMLALFAADLHDRGELAGDTVVVTVMSNLGFRLAMEQRGVRIVETPVGDRHVLAALQEGGYSLGGEQSGHLIFPARATTGDGLLASLLLADLVRRSGTPLAALAAGAMTTVPQILRNVRVDRRPDSLDALAGEVAAAEAELGADGRVLLRTSGTEPLVRVMVEAGDPAVAERITAALVAAAEQAYGGEPSPAKGPG